MPEVVGDRHVRPALQQVPGERHHRDGDERLKTSTPTCSTSQPTSEHKTMASDDHEKHAPEIVQTAAAISADSVRLPYLSAWHRRCSAHDREATGTNHGFVSGDRRRGLHRVSSGGGAVAARPSCPHCGQLRTGSRHNVAHLHGVELLEGDLADTSFAEGAAQGMDFVLHQAAIPSVPRSVEDPWPSNRSNIDATLSVLMARVKRV